LTNDLSVLCMCCVDTESLCDTLSAELATQRAEVTNLHASIACAEASASQQASALADRTDECGRLQTRLVSQDELIRQLQSTINARVNEEVDVAAAKQQLSSTLVELDASKTRAKAIQGQLTAALQSLHQAETVAIPSLQQQLQQAEATILRSNTLAEKQTRALASVVEQVKQHISRDPFSERLSAPLQNESTQNIALDDLSTSSSPLSVSTDAFPQLRDRLNAQLLELSGRNRQAFALLLSAERSIKFAQEELSDVKRQNAQMQRDAAETAAENNARLQTLEQQYLDVNAQLLASKSELQETQSIIAAHHAQVRTLWQSCQLMHRAFRPLLARFKAVVQQKEWLASQLFSVQTGVARHVASLRGALEGTSSEDQSNALPLHPYRLHAPRLSLRSVAIAVVAARRLWSLETGEYGSIIQSGGEQFPLLPIAPFQLSDNRGLSQDEAQIRREREMAVPFVDDSTLTAAAASLQKLVSHFDRTVALSASIYPQLNPQSARTSRSSVYSRGSMLHLLASSFGPFGSSRSKRVSRPARALGTREDLNHIWRIVLKLATRSKELEQQLMSAQQDYVQLIASSTRTEEQLSAEQQRAHSIMRDAVEHAREQELRAAERVEELQQQLQICEAEKAERITKDELEQLQENLAKRCTLLDEQLRAAQTQRTTLQHQVHQVSRQINRCQSI
jgi:chromosome segregation ATPase